MRDLLLQVTVVTKVETHDFATTPEEDEKEEQDPRQVVDSPRRALDVGEVDQGYSICCRVVQVEEQQDLEREACQDLSLCMCEIVVTTCARGRVQACGHAGRCGWVRE